MMRTLPRRLLGLLAMLSAFAGPASSMLHGVAHAAEATEAHRPAPGSHSSADSSLGLQSFPMPAAEAPDHEALHAAQTISATSSLKFGLGAALPIDTPKPAALSRARASGTVVAREEREPPGSGKRRPDDARAPPRT